MAVGRRCSIGCETWPDKIIYSTCPICGEKTSRFRNAAPLEDNEAESILLHKQFEAYYQRWCARHGQPIDGPLPDSTDTLFEAC